MASPLKDGDTVAISAIFFSLSFGFSVSCLLSVLLLIVPLLPSRFKRHLCGSLFPPVKLFQPVVNNDPSEPRPENNARAWFVHFFCRLSLANITIFFAFFVLSYVANRLENLAAGPAQPKQPRKHVLNARVKRSGRPNSACGVLRVGASAEAVFSRYER